MSAANENSEATDAAEVSETATQTEPDDAGWEDWRIRGALEAMLFAADEPLPMTAILATLPRTREAAVRRVLGQMQLDWAGEARGIWLKEVAGGYQFRTNPDYNETLLGLFEAKPTKLSRAAMETLAIVAYRQPVTKSVIDEIRGVDCGAVLRSLTDFELIGVLGKADDIGRPNLYGTTKRFLEFFSLSSLTELPTLEDFEVDALELIGEDVEQLLGEREEDEGVPVEPEEQHNG